MPTKRVLIAGFGLEGESAVEYFLDQGATVTVHDQKYEPEFNADIVAKYRDRGAVFQFGTEAATGEFDLVVRSPGVSPRKLVISEQVKRGVPVTSPTKIFFENCQSPIIGVTGTKGKGTTSSLILEMLKADGRSAMLAGNIGLPALTLLGQLTPDTTTVLELSSFQLMDLTQSPHIAVVLMTTVEHLDVHADEAEYVEAKAQIAAHQSSEDFIIFNADYPNSRKIGERSVGKKFEVSNRHEVPSGCFVRGNEIVWRADGQDEIVATLEDVRLPGRHNLENVCAAIAAAKCAGVRSNAIVEALHAFTGLEHRLELVREINGVKYYNDSFATTPESAIAAIQAFEVPEVLILGGSSKGSNFTELAKTVVAHPSIRGIVGIGVEWPKIKEAVVKAGGSKITMIEGLTVMNEMVAAASKLAKSGDVVLLSPACASFGLFKNYKERGKQFKQQAKEL